MARTEGQETVYPLEYAHIEDKVRAVQERVRQLDEQIKNVPENSKLNLTLTPPGFSRRPLFNRETKIAALSQEKAELKDTTFSQIEQELREADPKLARVVKDNAREDLFPSEAKRMSVQEKNEFGKQRKDVEEAQDLMNSFFSTTQKKVVKDSQETNKETPKKKATSMSWRFEQGLGYTKASEKTDKTLNDFSKNLDLDTLFPSGPAIYEKSSQESSGTSKAGKDMSVMSTRFLQGISYTKANVKTNSSPDKSREQDIDKD